MLNDADRLFELKNEDKKVIHEQNKKRIVHFNPIISKLTLFTDNIWRASLVKNVYT